MSKQTALAQLRKPLDLKSMPRNQARVEIAKDILAAMEAKKLVATRGTYFTPSGVFQEDVKDTIKNMPSCEVCARGAALTAIVAREAASEIVEPDNYSGNHPLDYEDSQNFFTTEELNEMEHYFEVTSTYSQGSEGAMTAICRAIIDSDGWHVVP